MKKPTAQLRWAGIRSKTGNGRPSIGLERMLGRACIWRVKRLWEFGKVRYCGLQKNATRAFTALALANIYLSRQSLTGTGAPMRRKIGEISLQMAPRGWR